VAEKLQEPGQNLEARARLRVPDDGRRPVRGCLRPDPQPGIGVAVSRPEPPQTREAVLPSGQDQPDLVPVLESGGMHRHRRQQILDLHLDKSICTTLRTIKRLVLLPQDHRSVLIPCPGAH
jgi:hypothetical protein